MLTQHQQLCDNELTLDSEVLDLKIKLMRQWPCKDLTCHNHGKSCWQPDADQSAAHHWPLYPDLFTAWCKGIADGELDKHEPSRAIAVQLEVAKQKGHTRTTLKQQQISGAGNMRLLLQLHIHNYGPGATTNVAIVSTTATAPPSSSPPLLWQRSSQVDITDKAVAFFDWLKLQSSWRGRSAAIDHMKALLVDEKDLSLKQIAAASKVDWIRWGLVEGHFDHVLSGVHQYRKQADGFEDIDDFVRL